MNGTGAEEGNGQSDLHSGMDRGNGGGDNDGGGGNGEDNGGSGSGRGGCGEFGDVDDSLPKEARCVPARTFRASRASANTRKGRERCKITGSALSTASASAPLSRSSREDVLDEAELVRTLSLPPGAVREQRVDSSISSSAHHKMVPELGCSWRLLHTRTCDVLLRLDGIV